MRVYLPATSFSFTGGGGAGGGGGGGELRRQEELKCDLFPTVSASARPGGVGGGGEFRTVRTERERFHGCTGSFSARAFVWQPLLLRTICTSIAQV